MKISADSLNTGTVWQNAHQKSEQSASFQTLFDGLQLTEQEDHSSVAVSEKIYEENHPEFDFNEFEEEIKGFLTTIPLEEGYFIQSPLLNQKITQLAELADEDEGHIILTILTHSESMENIFAQLNEQPAAVSVILLTVMAGIMQLPGSKEITELKNELISYFHRDRPDLIMKDSSLAEAIKIFNEYDQSGNQMSRTAENNRSGLVHTPVNENLIQAELTSKVRDPVKNMMEEMPLSAQKYELPKMTGQYNSQNLNGDSNEAILLVNTEERYRIYSLGQNIGAPPIKMFNKIKTAGTEGNKNLPVSGMTGQDVQRNLSFSESGLQINTGKAEGFSTSDKEIPAPQNKQLFNNQVTEAFKRSKPLFKAIGSSQMTIRLAPEHLGMLTIKLQQQDGKTIAKIITSTQSAKELVEQGIHQLKQVLPAISIQVDRFEIYSEQLEPSFNRSHEEADQHRREQDRSRKESKEDERDTFKAHLNMLT
ncbi:flagellar hook-length control protein FliK [Bacillus sp. V2I10]|uniref:flagellar hook-length control protein FliK n=1 Tax=Bacillus sp. V2I10 TaxID=3042276 RepID=UPI0027843F89|nr:flagellar hook-length control protein FliK [Bacillus sp. V2I10]MDQ0860123.1 flagellar hook-length control protein FliK [Bacillus sp. V2I10]